MAHSTCDMGMGSQNVYCSHINLPPPPPRRTHSPSTSIRAPFKFGPEGWHLAAYAAATFQDDIPFIHVTYFSCHPLTHVTHFSCHPLTRVTHSGLLIQPRLPPTSSTATNFKKASRYLHCTPLKHGTCLNPWSHPWLFVFLLHRCKLRWLLHDLKRSRHAIILWLVPQRGLVHSVGLRGQGCGVGWFEASRGGNTN